MYFNLHVLAPTTTLTHLLDLFRIQWCAFDKFGTIAPLTAWGSCIAIGEVHFKDSYKVSPWYAQGYCLGPCACQTGTRLTSVAG